MNSVSTALRRKVRRRACCLCEYCHSHEEVTGSEFTLDHIEPRAAEGASDYDNLCWCCFWCNAFKQARTSGQDPRTGEPASLFNPRLHRWEDHFRWSRDSSRVIGKTPVGRATVAALRLNRPVLVRARKKWVRLGFHPP